MQDVCAIVGVRWSARIRLEGKGCGREIMKCGGALSVRRVGRRWLGPSLVGAGEVVPEEPFRCNARTHQSDFGSMPRRATCVRLHLVVTVQALRAEGVECALPRHPSHDVVVAWRYVESSSAPPYE